MSPTDFLLDVAERRVLLLDGLDIETIRLGNETLADHTIAFGVLVLDVAGQLPLFGRETLRTSYYLSHFLARLVSTLLLLLLLLFVLLLLLLFGFVQAFFFFYINESRRSRICCRRLAI